MTIQSILEQDYEFDVDMLIEPIQKATLARLVAQVRTELRIEQDTIKLSTLAEDFNLNIESDPVNIPKSEVGLTRQTYHVPVIDTMLSYYIEELLRMEGTKLPYNERVAKAGKYFARVEDVMLFGSNVFQDGVPIADYTPLAASGNYTPATSQFDISTYEKGITTFAEMLKQLVTTYGNLKGYDINFIVTPDVYGTMLGNINLNSDRHLFDELLKMLRNVGSNNSNIYVSHYLGATLSKSKLGDVTITENNTNAMLLLNDIETFMILASPFDKRKETSEINGIDVALIERWFPFVFKNSGIIYSDTVVLS